MEPVFFGLRQDIDLPKKSFPILGLVAEPNPGKDKERCRYKGSMKLETSEYIQSRYFITEPSAFLF